MLRRCPATIFHSKPHVSLPVFRFATVSGQSFHWFLKRNCSASPAQLGWMYGFLCLISLGIGVMFWAHGATFVLPFAWLELTAVGIAFFIYARHATDGERIELHQGRLTVELESAGRIERAEFIPAYLLVEPHRGDRSLIELSGQGRSVCVGRYVRPEHRAALAREIRMAIRGA